MSDSACLQHRQRHNHSGDIEKTNTHNSTTEPGSPFSRDENSPPFPSCEHDPSFALDRAHAVTVKSLPQCPLEPLPELNVMAAEKLHGQTPEKGVTRSVASSVDDKRDTSSATKVSVPGPKSAMETLMRAALERSRSTPVVQSKNKTKAKRETAKQISGAAVAIGECGADGEEQTNEVVSSSRKVPRKSRRKAKPPLEFTTEKEVEVPPVVLQEEVAEATEVTETIASAVAVTPLDFKEEAAQLRAALAASLGSMNPMTSTPPSVSDSHSMHIPKPKPTSVFPLFLKKQDRTTAEKPLLNNDTRDKHPPIEVEREPIVATADTKIDESETLNPHSTQPTFPDRQNSLKPESVENGSRDLQTGKPSSKEPSALSMNFFAPRPRLDVHVSAVHAMINKSIAGKHTPWPTGDAMHNGHVRQLDMGYNMDLKTHWHPRSIWSPNALAGHLMRDTTWGSTFLGIGMDQNPPRRGKGKEKGKQRAVQLDPTNKSRTPTVRVYATPADILQRADRLYPGENGTNSIACSRLREQFLEKRTPDGYHSYGPESMYTPSSIALTEKYSPTCANDILGSRNSENAHALLGWLKKWSLATTPRERSGISGGQSAGGTMSAEGKRPREKIRKEEPPKRRRRRRRKLSTSSMDDFIVDDDDFLEPNSDSDSGLSFDDKRGDPSSTPSPLMIISGPAGTGKTACVHAVAREAGYDVFELHPGMKRSARDVLALVGEVTQNHVMAGWTLEEEQGLEQATVRSGRAIFPSSSRQPAPEETEPIAIGKNDESSTKKENVEGPKKRKKKTKCEATNQVEEPIKSNPWAKMGIAMSTAPSTSEVGRKKPKVEHGPSEGETSSIPVACVSSSEPPSSTTSSSSSLTTPLILDVVDTVSGVPPANLESASIKTNNGANTEGVAIEGWLDAGEHEMISKALHRPVASSSRRPVLILLEEADILFEEDQTFWRAVLTLAERRRRPIVLTCNNLDGLEHELINDFVDSTLTFHHILSEELTPYLHLLSICEGVLPRIGELEDFCKLWNGDLRRALHEFTFWCRTSGIDLDMKVVDLNDLQSDDITSLPLGYGMNVDTTTKDMRIALNVGYPTLPEMLLGVSPSTVELVEKEVPVDRLVDVCRTGLHCWGIDADQILGAKWERLAVDEEKKDNTEQQNIQSDSDMIDVGGIEMVPLPAHVDDQRESSLAEQDTLDEIKPGNVVPSSPEAKDSVKQMEMQILDAMARQAETASFADGELGITRWRQEQLYGTDSYSRCASEPLSRPFYLHKQPLCSAMTLRSGAADHGNMDIEIRLRIEIMARREFDSWTVPELDGQVTQELITESVPKSVEQAARLLGNAIETIGGKFSILEEERELAWEALRELGIARGGFGGAADAESPPPRLVKAIGPLLSSACATRLGTSFGPGLLAYAGKIAQIDEENVRRSLMDPTRQRRGGRRQEARRYLGPYISPEFAEIVAEGVNFH